MKDSIGQPLAVGDHVAYVPAYSSHIDIGTVLDFTPQNVRVVNVKSANKKGSLRDPSAVVKITEQYKHFAENHPELLV